MKNEPALRAMLTKLGFQLEGVADLTQFLNRKVTSLYRDQPKFQAFLDKQTAYCVPGTTGIDRWRHYLDDRTAHKTCAECGTPLTIYTRTYCSDACARRASAGVQRAPQDPNKLEANYLTRLASRQPDYTLVTYGAEASTFKHVCGATLTANNQRLLYGAAKCQCLHRRVIVQSVENLRRLFHEHDSNWIPSAMTVNGVECVNRVCGHTEVIAVHHYTARCRTCFKNHLPQASKIKTTEQYREELAVRRPDFQLLGEWVSQTTPTEYRHSVCDGTFKSLPEYVRRPEFECPVCRKARASEKVLSKANSLSDKVPTAQVKEELLRECLTERTDWDLSDLLSGPHVPQVSYRDDDRNRRQMYRPPFYLPNRNLLIEVRTPYTLGLLGTVGSNDGPRLWAINCAKAKACKRNGFKFLVLLFVGNRYVQMPKKWYDLDYSQALTYFQTKFNLGDLQ